MLSFNWSDQFNVSWPVLQVSLTNQNKTELQFTQCTFWWITADCSPPNIYRNRHILTWFHRIQIKWAEHSALNVLVLFHTAKRVFVVVCGDEFTSVAHLCSLRSCRWSHSRPTLNRHQTVRLFNWCKKVFTGRCLRHGWLSSAHFPRVVFILGLRRIGPLTVCHLKIYECQSKWFLFWRCGMFFQAKYFKRGTCS